MRAGAFGSVSKTRYEVLLQGTRDELPTADAEWREYDFVAKPGAPERRPPLLSPYHLRLDWLLWFLPVLLLNLAGGVLLVTLLRIVRTGELFELRRRKNAGRA